MSHTLIAPSILSADFVNLAGAIDQVSASAAKQSVADWIHVDVMDNHFVPNLTLGLPVVESILNYTTVPVDCHLMIDDPHRWAPGYAEAGAYNVTFHIEATDNPLGIAADIRKAGSRAGLALKPDTSLDDYLDILSGFDTILIMSVQPGFGGQKFISHVLDKVRTLRRKIDREKLQIIIEIDGGINLETISFAAEAGVDCFVAGSAIYNASDPADAIAKLRANAHDAKESHHPV